MSDERKQVGGFKRTKIVCTLGPATDDDAILRGMIDGGMDVARLNLSHGKLDEHLARIQRVRRIAGDAGRHVAVMFDTRGPDIRIGDLDAASVKLEKGKEFVLTGHPLVGNAQRASVSYPGLPKLLHPKDSVYLDDGLIELEVIESGTDEVRCRIVAGGTLSPHKGVNVPGKIVPLPILTDADVSDLKTGLNNGIDYIAASFVRTSRDIEDIRSALGGARVRIIAKIETASGIENLGEIIKAVDGLMVARGDLGIEIPPENVPGVQKRIIHASRPMMKPVVTATEMLESMTRNPRPTRAEIADVANAVLDGTSAVMLSQETAIGKYPVQAVEIMARVCRTAEMDLPFDPPLHREPGSKASLRGGIAHAAYFLAHDIDASAIICITDSGRTAEHFSRLQPCQPVLACTPDAAVARRLALYWGILPIVVDEQESVEALLGRAIDLGKAQGIMRKGDRIVFTGNLSGRGGETNLLASVVVG